MHTEPASLSVMVGQVCRRDELDLVHMEPKSLPFLGGQFRLNLGLVPGVLVDANVQTEPKSLRIVPVPMESDANNLRRVDDPNDHELLDATDAKGSPHDPPRDVPIPFDTFSAIDVLSTIDTLSTIDISAKDMVSMDMSSLAEVVSWTRSSAPTRQAAAKDMVSMGMSSLEEVVSWTGSSAPPFRAVIEDNTSVCLISFFALRN